jgi:hypothetical protein
MEDALFRTHPMERCEYGVRMMIGVQARSSAVLPPLVIVIECMGRNKQLAPGERIVEHEYRISPLYIEVHERITSDPLDHGTVSSQPPGNR